MAKRRNYKELGDVELADLDSAQRLELAGRSGVGGAVRHAMQRWVHARLEAVARASAERCTRAS